jgi:uncharacterized protein
VTTPRAAREARSGDAEDAQARARRRARALLIVGAAVLLLIIGLIVRAARVDLTPARDATTAPAADAAVPPDAELIELLHGFARDVQHTFTQVFAAEGLRYREAALEIVSGDVETACGKTRDLIGFYCHQTETAYLALSFYRDRRQRLGVAGDLLQAYVVAHELGHHVQELFGTHARIAEEVARDPSREHELWRHLELQADCYAGVWAHWTGRFDLAGVRDLATVLAGWHTNADPDPSPPDSGVAPWRPTLEPIVHWFEIGLERGTLSACETLAPRAP